MHRLGPQRQARHCSWEIALPGDALPNPRHECRGTSRFLVATMKAINLCGLPVASASARLAGHPHRTYAWSCVYRLIAPNARIRPAEPSEQAPQRVR
jgi:hypothetical protein